MDKVHLGMMATLAHIAGEKDSLKILREAIDNYLNAVTNSQKDAARSNLNMSLGLAILALSEESPPEIIKRISNFDVAKDIADKMEGKD
jgi:hypothetical protein